MANVWIEGFLRDETTGALAVSGTGGGGTTVTVDGVEINPLEITTDLAPSAAAIRTELSVPSITDLTDHTGDTSGAHAATAISFTPAGTIAASTVQAAIEEVASEGGGAASMAVPEIAAAIGMKSVTVDASVSVASLSPTGGIVYYGRAFDTPAATFSKVWVVVTTAGVDAGALLANCFVGLYYKSGTNLVLAGSSTDQTATFKSTGAKGITITEASAGSLTGRGGSSEPLVPALLIGTQSTTAAQFGSTGNTGVMTNMGLTANTDLLRGGRFSSALSALPSTIALTAGHTSGVLPVFGIV